MFERENAFYEINREQFREKYPGKELVIVGDEIIGVYDDLKTAIDKTVQTHPLGTFCVKDVPIHPEDEEVWIPSFWVGL
ncbi:MAG: hypothetical protein LBI06_00915 [Treponema sp.]|jgi:hypothetical protein|nr:hypothetical protein [Treponema sp.]